MDALLLAHYEVADRERFLQVFDDFEEARVRAGGVTRGLVESPEHAGAFTAMIAFPSREAAEAFARGPERRDALGRASVLDHTDEILDVVRPFTAAA